jgi:hypothetical protein
VNATRPSVVLTGMSHRRTDSASSAATDVSMQSGDEVAEMLTRSQSTISEASIPEPTPGAPLTGPSAAPLSREGSMGSVASVLSVTSISDIIQPDQETTIKELLDNLNKHPTTALVKLATGDLTILSRIDPSDRLLPAPSDTKQEVRIDCHRLLDAMLRYASSDSESEDSRKAERYVAAAIVSCRGDLDQYVRLANTWFGLFLWPCASTYFIWWLVLYFLNLFQSDTTVTIVLNSSLQLQHPRLMTPEVIRVPLLFGIGVLP